MVNCCVYGCKSRSERNLPNITFHRFPNEPLLRIKWIECTGRVNWHPSHHSRICSRHFEASCLLQKLNRTLLNPRSIPTLFIQSPTASDPPLRRPSDPSFSKGVTLGVDMGTRDYALPNDMENYMQYTVMGSVSKIRMKPDCLPSKFQCQLDRIKRTARIKRRKRIQDKVSKETGIPDTLGMTSNSDTESNSSSSNDQEFEEIKKDNPFCICCLEEDVPFIDVLTCAHAEFLDNFVKPELNSFTQIICIQCHNILKKIQQFKVQVEDSFKFLTQETEKESRHSWRKNRQNKFKLQQTKIVDVNLPGTDLNNVEIKTEKADDLDDMAIEENTGFEVYTNTNNFGNKFKRERNSLEYEGNIENMVHTDITIECIKSENDNDLEDGCGEENTALTTYDDDTNFENIFKMEVNSDEEIVDEIKNKKIEDTINNFEIHDETFDTQGNIIEKNVGIHENTIEVLVENIKDEVLPSVSNNKKSVKNIEEALRIINNNANNNCINLLASSIQSLTSDNLFNITALSNLKKDHNYESVLAKNLVAADHNYGKSVMEKSSTVTHDSSEKSVLEKAPVASVSGTQNATVTSLCDEKYEAGNIPPRLRDKIKTIKITESQLIQERTEILYSNAFTQHPYRCERCLVGFYYEENLHDHVKRKHTQKNGGWTCEVCEQVLPDASYEEHTNRHYTRYQCVLCSTRFEIMDAAVRHFKTEHGLKRKCKKTNKKRKI